TITDIAPLLVIGWAGYEVITGNLSVGTMAAFMGYIERLYAPLRRLMNSSTTLTQSIASMDRMFELMDEKYDVTDKNGARHLPAIRGQVDFEKVTFKYDEDGQTILNQIDFQIKPGETAAFVGMSGGGKSTIVSLIPRFYDVT